MLSKMGFREGLGLGQNEQGELFRLCRLWRLKPLAGRTEPVRFAQQEGFSGLGKTEQDAEHLKNALTRKEMASLKLMKESEEERLLREAKIAQKEAVRQEVQEVLAKFHCEPCNKSYKNARQWEEHLQSYGHAQVKRKLERAAEVKSALHKSGELEKRRERERQREEKELKRMGVLGGFAASSPSTQPEASTSTSVPAPKLGFKKVAAPLPVSSASPIPEASSSALPEPATSAVTPGPAIKMGFKKFGAPLAGTLISSAPEASTSVLPGTFTSTAPIKFGFNKLSAPSTSNPAFQRPETTQQAVPRANAFGDEEEDEPDGLVSGKSASGKAPALPKIAFGKLKRP
jgi:hypothetical protein